MISSSKEIIRYGIAGIINTFIGYSIFIALVYLLNINLYYSNIIAYFLGLCMAFILNKYFVFNVKQTTKTDVIKFFVSFFIAYGTNIFVLFLCFNIFNLNPATSQVLAMVSYTVNFYILNKLIVFRNIKE